MLRTIAVVALLVACGKSKGKDTPSAAPGTSSAPAGSGSATAAATPKELPPCPAGDALEAKTAELFGVAKDAIDTADCVVGKFPQPAWMIAARYTPPAGSGDDVAMTHERTVLVDASGKIISSVADEIPPGAVDSSGTGDYQAVDLDGDGTDELLSVFSSDKRGYILRVLIAQRLGKDTWDTILTRQFEYDNSAAEPEGGVLSCEATWKLEAAAGGKRPIVFEPKGKVPKQASAEDCVLKKETWTIGADGKYAKSA